MKALDKGFMWEVISRPRAGQWGWPSQQSENTELLFLSCFLVVVLERNWRAVTIAVPRKEIRAVMVIVPLNSSPWMSLRSGVLPWAGSVAEGCGSSAAGNLLNWGLCNPGLSFYVSDRLFHSILLKDEDRKMIMKADVVLSGYYKGGI